MGKGPTTNKHHCPGANGWVGDESPGNCTPSIGRLIYCTKHQMPCRQGCPGKKHLKNQPGCLSCKAKWQEEAKQKRKAKEKSKENEKGKELEDFLDRGKEKKKKKK
ncbi:hypothetical protein BKA58DRAFT_60835 [Alternaria rosae]|uniref:uncharacterized protein n=1 Tax=Alternaria rosae TaxID=1187941 RepID=UPI001E8D7EFE|nr:uncharacterized protein BKA58DRAFT_60835 [Alternaria rosae]KAH6852858.1 hypothetical protein BKA58DRAFT_60835 [Alternaria rosae]